MADSAAGMQVINYLPFDNKGIPPTITLDSNFSPGVAEENSLMRLTAVTSDDVQVRNVEFYIDGTLAATDGNYPFETRFTTPLTTSQPFFNIRVKATDTGGNFAWTDTIRYTLVTDATPPRLLTTAPQPAAWMLPNSVNTVSATFNESILPASVTATTFRLFDSGLDKLLGTEDDQQVPGTVGYDEATKTAWLKPPTALGINSYRAVINVTDIAGNPLKGGEFNWNFFIGVTNWDGGGDNRSWHDAQNWSNDLLPVDGALVVIDSTDTNEIIFSQGEVALTSVQSNRPLRINGGKLTINGDSVIDANFSLTLGELSGSGTVTVTGTLTWTSGKMTGSGKTIATNNLVLGGAQFSAHHLQQRQLENVGVATLYSGYFYIYDSGLFINRVGASFTDLSTVGGILSRDSLETGQILNAGTFTKSGNGPIVISQITLTNTGTLNIQADTLNLSATTINSGIINLATSTTLDVNKVFVNQASGRISGTGTLDYHSATSFTNDGTIDPTVIVVP